jgi:hypothetical protein
LVTLHWLFQVKTQNEDFVSGRPTASTLSRQREEGRKNFEVGGVGRNDRVDRKSRHWASQDDIAKTKLGSSSTRLLRRKYKMNKTSFISCIKV